MIGAHITRQAGRVAAALAVAMLACSSEDVPTLNPGDVSRVVVSPATLALQPGETGDLDVTAYDVNGAQVAVATVTWETENPATATVGDDGAVTGVAPGTATITAFVGEKNGKATVTVTPMPPTGLVIEVYPGVTHQTMTGWEGVSQIGELECHPVAFQAYRNSLLDAVVNDLGLNRVRLEVRSGAENPVDWYTRYVNKEIDHATYRSKWYEAVNDNADPQSLNAAGVQWSLLDSKIDQIVMPLRQRLAARGEKLFVNLNYVDFGTSPFEHSSDPQEYAELILGTFRHIQSKYGWVPDAVEMILEPDNTPNWRAATIGPVIVATGDRLAAAGFRPAFIAPSTTSMTNAVSYFDELIQFPRVREYLTDLSYHRYSGVSSSTLRSIGDRAVEHGIRTGMLEHIGSGYTDLHADILTGQASSWQQFAIAFCTVDNGAQYYTIDESNPSAPVVSEAARTRVLKQYFRHVRLGAVRVGAASGDNRFSPLAFRNTNGRFVVVIKADAGASLQVRGLPSGTYGISHTNGSQSGVSPDVTITSQQALSVTTPNGGGVVTVFQR